ncbi:MAG TPA: hypothetical protein VGX23_07815 [Actinocrinis sp.]|nr:hypothetical protein [Actinocrinis sp.]
MELKTLADLTAVITPERRERIEAAKQELVDAERGHELAALAPTVETPAPPT